MAWSENGMVMYSPLWPQRQFPVLLCRYGRQCAEKQLKPALLVGERTQEHALLAIAPSMFLFL